MRIIWQISPKNKLAVYNDRILKDRGAAMTAGFDPATASIIWNSPIYTTGSVKFTSTVSSKIFVEGGFSTNYERYNTIYQPGIAQERGTPGWYSTINKQDTALGTSWNAGEAQRGMSPDRFALSGSMSYVTGAHNVKLGVQDTWGRYARWRNANGDLRAQFTNGRAFQAQILNTPVNFQDNLRADVGIYGQDSWTLNRLTLNYGARWEYFASGIDREASEGGRFTRPANSGRSICRRGRASRRGSARCYDVFGNQRTAVKFSLGKYMQQGTTGFSEAYNPLALTTATVAWTDLNADGVPQGELGLHLPDAGCEINLATTAGRLRRGEPVDIRSGHRADVQRRAEHQHPAGAVAAASR